MIDWNHDWKFLLSTSSKRLGRKEEAAQIRAQTKERRRERGGFQKEGDFGIKLNKIEHSSAVEKDRGTCYNT